jgi:hypothetical protein
MNLNLKKEILQLNPWLTDSNIPVVKDGEFIYRVQIEELLHEEWDDLWTILIGVLILPKIGKSKISKGKKIF